MFLLARDICPNRADYITLDTACQVFFYAFLKKFSRGLVYPNKSWPNHVFTPPNHVFSWQISLFYGFYSKKGQPSSSIIVVFCADATLSSRLTMFFALASVKVVVLRQFIISSRGCACQGKTYAGLVVVLRRFATNFRFLRGFSTKIDDFASGPPKFLAVKI